MNGEEMRKSWSGQSEEIISEIAEWRQEHPKATFREMEAEVLSGKVNSDKKRGEVKVGAFLSLGYASHGRILPGINRGGWWAAHLFPGQDFAGAVRPGARVARASQSGSQARQPVLRNCSQAASGACQSGSAMPRSWQ